MKTRMIKGKNVNLVPFMKEKSMKESRNAESMLSPRDGSPGAGNSQRNLRRGSAARFLIQTTGEGTAIGTVSLERLDWNARSGWIGFKTGAGDRKVNDCHSEAMQLLLGYAFNGLNLNRVTLNLVTCDARIIRTFEEAGFRYEGTQREVVALDDQHLDIVDMGMLRSEWDLLTRYPPEGQTPI